MSKISKRICLTLTVILLPIICLIGVFSINSSGTTYETTVTMTDGVVNLLSGEFYGTSVASDDTAYSFLDSIKNEYGFSSAKDEFIFEKSVDVANGKVYRFKQIKNGIEVYGRQLIINVDEQGRVISVSGNYKCSNAKMINVNIDELEQYAINNLGISEIYQTEVVVYNSIENVDAVCYLVNCLYEGNTVDIIIDASTYEFYQITSSNSQLNNLSSYSFVTSEVHEQLDSNGKRVEVNVETYRNKYTGDTIYLLSDKNRKIYMTVMSNGKTISDSNFFEYYLLDSSLKADDPMVVEGYKNLVKCYDYYADKGSFGTSIVGLKNEAGKSINLIAVVHAVETVGESYDNAAYWILNSNSSYAYFLFGDGGSFAEDYATSLDVVGHEYQHGITTSICNLEYLNEAGAINEAISDIFGAIIEGHDMSEKDFWLMGEDITLNNIAGFRDMSNPKNNRLAEEYPAHINEMYPLCTKKNCNHDTDDYGGVHYNSVILTHATYKMYSYDNEFFTPFVIGQLWYNTLTRLTTTSTFADFRIQMLASATALGYAEDKIAIINRSFADVGLVSADSEFKVSFYNTEEDFNSKQNELYSTTAIYGTKIILPSASTAPEGKLFYYWVDSENNTYLPGSFYEVKYEDEGLWAYYVSIDEIKKLNITFAGDGSDTNPYLIYSAVEWVYLSYLINNNYASYKNGSFNDKEYSLESDINLNNVEYDPIGNTKYPFEGYINGGNHTISGVNLSSSKDNYVGLLGVNYGSICNLIIGFGNTSSNSLYVGAIAGANLGYIGNCVSKLSISGKYTVGGLAGITYSSGGNSISNSYSEGNLSGDIVGGIAGDAIAQLVTEYDIIASSYIGNVYSTGELVGDIVGGIIGRCNGYYVVNSMVTGDISLSDNATTCISGGVIGYLMNEPIDGSSEGGTDCYSAVLSCKVVSNIDNSTNLSGMIIGKVINNSIKGKIIIENNTFKNTGTTELIGNYNTLTQEQLNCVILNNNKISDDGIYEGDFDFDNPDYYTNSDNWSVTRCVSLYNLENVWTINEPETMPKILNYDFWINHLAMNFSGGNGSASNPFLIGSAEELALFSAYINSDYVDRFGVSLNSYYSNKCYKLIADIDLTGKIWVGIGCTRYTYYQGRDPKKDYYGFSGTFDGNGHTISNMNSIAAQSVAEANAGEILVDRYLYSYEAGLFGLLYSNTNSTPVISNLSLKNVSVSGSYAGGVVAVCLTSAVIENVKVHSGNINGNTVAGGIVGIVGNNNSNTEVVITNSMNNARISSRIIGGIVGATENMIQGYNVNLQIKASVNRGTLVGFGDDANVIGSYYMPFVGGLVGVVGCNQTVLNDNVFMGEILMYSPGYAGGLIGSTGYESNVSQILVSSSHNKSSGNIIYKFKNSNCYSGGYLGAVLENANANIVINDNNSAIKTCSNLIGVEYQTATITIDDIYSEDENNYDYYNIDYYETAFSTSSSWTSDAIENMIVSVNFVDYDGTIIKSVLLPYGEKLNASETPNMTLSRESDAKYHYTFAGFEDFSNIEFVENSSIRAIYNTTLRSYDIIYKLEDGTVVFQTTGNYGTEISQDVKAPDKDGTLFLEYEFSGWEFESNTVTGEMIGVAKYKTVIGGSLLKLIIIAFVVFIIISMILNHFKEKRRRNESV